MGTVNYNLKGLDLEDKIDNIISLEPYSSKPISNKAWYDFNEKDDSFFVENSDYGIDSCAKKILEYCTRKCEF